MEILIRNTLRKTPVYDAYWKFAAERQNVFFRRLAGTQAPWTNDPVIRKYKFTNSYRVLDKVSQYLISQIILFDDDSELSYDDRLFRILLFKLFNKIETWQLLEETLTNISWEQYSFQRYDQVLSDAFNSGTVIYSAAYIMASGKRAFGFERKHQNHLKLLELMMGSGLTHRIRECTTMAQLYEVLLSYPQLGPFLAYQFATDINYSNLTDFSEEEFVVAGPGAQDGIAKCFIESKPYSNEDIIHYMMDRQEFEFERLDLNFRNLFGRSLKLVDCQNIFCEVGKYARVTHPLIKDKSGRLRIKQIYRNNGDISLPSFPRKWGLGGAVEQFSETHELGD